MDGARHRLEPAYFMPHENLLAAFQGESQALRCGMVDFSQHLNTLDHVMLEVTTTNAVIDALGGTRAVAELTGRGQSAASNWRNHPRFPANTYLTLTAALAAKGLTAPAWLWDMEARPPEPLTKAAASEVA
jgi:hypothetical protein